MGLFRRRFTRAAKIRTAILFAVGLSVTGAWVYTRFVMPKAPLAGPCRWSIECGSEAPTCMREGADTAGICSRMCDAGVDCAEGVRCMTVETDEHDAMQMPILAGYCFSESFLEARRTRMRGGKPSPSTSAPPKASAPPKK